MKNNLRLDSKSGAGSAARYNAGYVARGTAKEAVGDKSRFITKACTTAGIIVRWITF